MVVTLGMGSRAVVHSTNPPSGCFPGNTNSQNPGDAVSGGSKPNGRCKWISAVQSLSVIGAVGARPRHPSPAVSGDQLTWERQAPSPRHCSQPPTDRHGEPRCSRWDGPCGPFSALG